MSTKLKLLYVTFFIVTLIVVSFANHFYKNLSHIEVGHKYTVVADQYFNFKKNSLKKIIKKSINQSFQLKNIKIIDETLTLPKSKSSIQFDLLLYEFVDASEIEFDINKVYIGSIKEIVRDISSNKSIYDYEYLKSLYEGQIIEDQNRSKADIKNEYQELISSSLYKLYPPKIKCFFKSEQLCLNKFKRYYYDLYQALNVSALAMEMNTFKGEGSNLVEAPVFEILAEFEKQKKLFYIDGENSQFKEFKKEQYFQRKYNELLKSDFFMNYIPDEFCLNYNSECFRELGEYFNKILSKQQLEMKLPFKVKYVQKPKDKKSKVFLELPLNIAAAFIATYLFFIFTNRSFRIKIK